MLMTKFMQSLSSVFFFYNCFICVLQTFFIAKIQARSEKSSAITKAHQILLIFPVKDKSHAEGKSAKICLINETHILKKPRPNAWKTEVNVIPIAANGKWIAIIRNQSSHSHNNQCNKCTHFDRIDDSFFIFCTKIVSHNWNNSII